MTAPDTTRPGTPPDPTQPGVVAAAAVPVADPADVGSADDGAVARAVERWSRFFFAPQPATALGLVRIWYGLVMIGWAFSLLPDLLSFFGARGTQPVPPAIRYTWGLLHLWRSDAAVWAVWGLLLAAAVALTVGWHSRLAALLLAVCVLSFERREPYIFNSGDGLLRIEALFLALAPAGAALSLDRRRTARSFWSVQDRSPWVLRLMQIQLSIVYLSTVHDKLTGTTWNNGTAVSYSLRLLDLRNVGVPHWLLMNPLLMNLAAWGTLGLEISLGVLVWRRRWRLRVLAAGVLLHLTILLTLAVGFFSFSMFVLYLAFLPPEVAGRWVAQVRRRLTGPSRPVAEVFPAVSHEVSQEVSQPGVAAR